MSRVAATWTGGKRSVPAEGEKHAYACFEGRLPPLGDLYDPLGSRLGILTSGVGGQRLCRSVSFPLGGTDIKFTPRF